MPQVLLGEMNLFSWLLFSMELCRTRPPCLHAFSPYLSTRVTIPEHGRWGGLTHRAVFSHTSGGQKSKTRVSAGLAPS